MTTAILITAAGFSAAGLILASLALGVIVTRRPRYKRGVR